MTVKKSILLLLAISLLVYLKWVLPGIYFDGDWPYYPVRILKEFFYLPRAWTPFGDFGGLDLTLWRYPLFLTYGLFGVLHMDSSIADRVLVFFPTIILGNISVFYLTKKITRSSIGGIFGALVFNYNTYIFIVNTAFLLYSGAVWVVITLLFFMLSLEKKKLFFSILTLVSLWISSIYDIRMSYISCLLLFGYYTYYVIFIQKNIGIKAFIGSLSYLFSPISIFILLNLYWVFPLIFSKKLVTNSLLQRSLFGNEFLNILYSITLYHPFWSGAQIAAFNPQPILFYFWLIPIVAFLGLFVGKNNKHILFFGIVTILGVFLTKQVGQPFSYMYVFLFQHLPGFSAFREATKFYFIISLGYSVLIGSFVSFIGRLPIARKYLQYKVGILVLLFVVLMSNTLPFIFGKTAMSNAYVKDEQYYVLENYLFNQRGFFRHLWIPRGSKWSTATYDKPGYSADVITNGLWAKYYLSNLDYDAKKIPHVILTSLTQSYSQSLLSVYSIKYIIVPIQDDKNDADFFTLYGKNRQYYIDNLNKISYLKKIDIGTKDIAIYENPTVKPHIYLTAEEESIYKNILYQKVIYSSPNTSLYVLPIEHISQPVYLNFSSSFSPNWELHLGSFNWFEALVKKNYSLSVNHFANDAGLNSFYIDPKVVCLSATGCVKNPDGSYSMKLILYFKPQEYLYFGLIISSVTLLGVLVALVILGIKEIKNYGKKN